MEEKNFDDKVDNLFAKCNNTNKKVEYLCNRVEKFLLSTTKCEMKRNYVFYLLKCEQLPDAVISIILDYADEIVYLGSNFFETINCEKKKALENEFYFPENCVNLWRKQVFPFFREPTTKLYSFMILGQFLKIDNIKTENVEKTLDLAISFAEKRAAAFRLTMDILQTVQGYRDGNVEIFKYERNWIGNKQKYIQFWEDWKNELNDDDHIT